MQDARYELQSFNRTLYVKQLFYYKNELLYNNKWSKIDTLRNKNEKI